MRKLIYGIFLIISSIAFGQESELFAKANAHYAEGEFEEAIVDYRALLDSGQESVALYYNLGNAHYKRNEVASSIYYYEKGLKLNPGDVDIKNNLKFAQRATIDQVEVLPEGFIKKSIKSMTNTFGLDTWAWLSILGIVLFVVLFILYYTAGSSSGKRLFFMTSWVSFILGLVALGFAFKQHNDLNTSRYAILFEQEVSVKSEPNSLGEVIFRLHEGTKVAVLEESRDWKKIRLMDGKTGWVLSEKLKEL